MSAPTTCVIAPAGPDRWTLAVDGQVLATSDHLQHLQRLAELAHLDVAPGYRIPPDADEELADELRSAVRARVERHGLGPTLTDVLVADWLITRLAYDRPDVARALLALAALVGARP